MLHAPVQPPSYSLRERKSRVDASDSLDPSMADIYDDDEGGGSSKTRNKSRRELPAGAVATLKAWLLSPEHFTHPYPTPQDQVMLMQKTGIDKKQLKNWFTNARRRIWKPMLKKQIEQGKLTAAPPGVGGAMPGLMVAGAGTAAVLDSAHSVQAMRVHYQQAVDQTQMAQQANSDPYGNQKYHAVTSTDVAEAGGSGLSAVHPSGSIGTLPQLSSSTQLSKTDSHAVLMELFARDQDLVRQATESARLKVEAKQQQSSAPASGSPATPNQHPMKAPSTTGMAAVPTLNSWPHFSSITSLSNLGSLPGVKSVSSFTGIDLSSKGNLSKFGSLAQLKSVDSLGKNDSYAFLEVFFGGDRNSTANLSAMGGARGGSKQAGEEDNEIGLSLEDEAPSSPQPVKPVTHNMGAPTVPEPASAVSTEPESGGTLKRAYDDAMAARGLISVSRSSEKLTDLVIPEKMRRTLSQEFVTRDKTVVTKAAHYAAEPRFTVPPKEATHPPSTSGTAPSVPAADDVDPETDGHVQVSRTTTCALCGQTNVDTQLRPCGHMFHERCLKPSFQTPSGPPTCPIDHIPMASALLAVPTEEAAPAATSAVVSNENGDTPVADGKEQNSWTFSGSKVLSTENQETPSA